MNRNEVLDICWEKKMKRNTKVNTINANSQLHHTAIVSDEKRIHKPDSNNKWLTLVGCNNCSICIMWSHSKHSVINYCRDRNLINEQRQLINLEITYLVKLTTRNFRCNLYSIPILAHRICVYVRLYVETRLMRFIIHNNRHLLWYTYRN